MDYKEFALDLPSLINSWLIIPYYKCNPNKSTNVTNDVLT